MRLRHGRERPATAGLFDANWDVLRAVVLAAHQGDRTAYLSQIVRFEELPADLHAQVQAALVLRWVLDRQIGANPTAQSISDLAWAIQARVAAVAGSVQGSLGALVDLMLFVYERRPGRDLDGASVLFKATAAIGALLEHPEADLEMARRAVESWATKHQFNFAGDLRCR